jgi:hypothetical protein
MQLPESRFDRVFANASLFHEQPGDVEIFIKATGAPGWHFIDLYPGIYKGVETRPNNFRERGARELDIEFRPDEETECTADVLEDLKLPRGRP